MMKKQYHRMALLMIVGAFVGAGMTLVLAFADMEAFGDMLTGLGLAAENNAL